MQTYVTGPEYCVLGGEKIALQFKIRNISSIFTIKLVSSIYWNHRLRNNALDTGK